MASPHLSTGQRLSMEGELTASSTLSLLTSSSSANTKGAYAELVASTTFACSGFMIIIINAHADDHLIDLAIGAAASEQIILSNLVAGVGSLGDSLTNEIIPVSIPAGTRLSARSQSTGTSRVISFSVLLFAEGALSFGGLTNIETMGASTTDSGGVSVDPGAVINTKGAYSQIIAATVRPTYWLVVAIGNQDNQVRLDAQWLIDIAIGAAASEQIFWPDMPTIARAGTDMVMPCIWAIPMSIPAGSRIAVRAQCSINDASDRLFDVACYGVS